MNQYNPLFFKKNSFDVDHFINLLQYYFCFYVLAFWWVACGIFVPWPGIEPTPHCNEKSCPLDRQRSPSVQSFTKPGTELGVSGKQQTELKPSPWSLGWGGGGAVSPPPPRPSPRRGLGSGMISQARRSLEGKGGEVSRVQCLTLEPCLKPLSGTSETFSWEKEI